MKKTIVIERLKKIIKLYVKDEKILDNITDSTNFIKDMDINSINMIDIVLDVETEFNIEIDDASMEKMITVGSAIDIIIQKIENRSADKLVKDKK